MSSALSGHVAFVGFSLADTDAVFRSGAVYSYLQQGQGFWKRANDFLTSVNDIIYEDYTQFGFLASLDVGLAVITSGFLTVNIFKPNERCEWVQIESLSNFASNIGVIVEGDAVAVLDHDIFVGDKIILFKYDQTKWHTKCCLE